jgi:adenosylhomocysteine nucleosidase
MLGIIGAMDEEVEGLKAMLDDVVVTEIAGMSFYKGSLLGKETVIVRCGIGKVNAAMCAQILIDKFNITGIINTGIAGSLNSDINIGDIVFSVDAVEHDMDVATLGYAPGVIPDAETSVYEADSYLMNIAVSATKKAGIGVSTFKGRVVSGDQFISSKEKKDWLVKTFDGTCAEMEGAAIAHAAVLNHIPFLVVRAISDKADDSAQMDYPEFAAKAIENSILMIRQIILDYEEQV